ncbi:alpha/beta fold hydrolase [Tsukamurella sp. M9C]|uniref:alpha/beta fold hydrolase n=1 Tax=Tsukamurella sp. M9C TaxID=2877520 RepID=UPI001CC9D19E|nr:alpha/beta fold hydrolase [Tsukamurella sp. M9C]MCA0155745.1 alpha/beta fold hydrolase [Tsukamurella sp. M9C]
MTTTAVLGDGTRLRYQLEGPEGAPTVVLSNSIATTAAMWDQTVPMMTGDLRVLRYDTRGHGGSDAPVGAYSVARLGRDVLELLDELGIDRAHFCGLSLGGMVGQWLGVHAPDRVNRLILANTSAYLGPSGQWDARIASLLAGEDLSDTADRFVRNWFPAELLADDQIVGPFRDAIPRMSPTGLAGCLSAVRDFDMRRTVALVKAPTLVIVGEHDAVCLPEHGEHIARVVRGAEIATLPVTHLSNVEAPQAFVDLVRQFLMA